VELPDSPSAVAQAHSHTRNPENNSRQETSPTSHRAYPYSLVSCRSPSHQMASRLTSGVYAKPLPHTTVEWLYDDLGQVRCHATRSLIDKMHNSQHAQPHRYELTHTLDTRVHPIYPVLYSFSKHTPFPFLKHSHLFKALTHF
jgi:hypothetical protein